MLTIAHCDDNDLQREILQDILENYAQTRQLDVCATAFSAGANLISAVRENGGYDIYILDMLMPGMNGLEVASTLRMMNDPGKIIFLTASLDYGIASYDVEAFYYMVKPVNCEKLYQILDKAFREIVPSKNDDLVIKTEKGELRVKLMDISFVNLSNRVLQYHTKDGKVVESVTIRTSFKDAIHPLLADGQFALCGAGTAVNLAEIDAMDTESVLLKNGELLYPPKSSYSQLKKAWKAFRRN